MRKHAGLVKKKWVQSLVSLSSPHPMPAQAFVALVVVGGLCVLCSFFLPKSSDFSEVGKHFPSRHVFQDHVQVGIVLEGRAKKGGKLRGCMMGLLVDVAVGIWLFSTTLMIITAVGKLKVEEWE